MRLIDADALKANFEANVPVFAQDMVPGMHYIIDRAKTIDAVQVVRCKDCKHYDKDAEICVLFTDEYTWQTDPSWYCADGERKES